jgi:methionyl-tRNA formyltransferase
LDLALQIIVLRIVFMGTAELSCASLRALAAMTDARVEAVVTQPDRARGRGMKVQPSPVKEMAVERGFRVLQPERARNEGFLLELQSIRPDLIVVAAYGQLLPVSVLEVPRFGCLNVHTSLLPKYRGAAPIQWALINGDAVTGVTIMKMDAGMDTGAIVVQKETKILLEDHSGTLHDRLAILGAEALVGAIPDFVAGRLQPRPQPAQGASHAPKIRKEDCRINWSLPAESIQNRIRAFSPWPGAYLHLPAEGQPRLLKVWEAQVESRAGKHGEILAASHNELIIGCGEQALRLLAVQPEGGRKMAAGQFLAGHRLEVGSLLA